MRVFSNNFLGQAPGWYKKTLITFLIINPILMFTVGSFVTGWVVIAEFIFTLAMALKCYPLPASGLIAIECVLMGMTNPESVYHEAVANFPVIMLLMFMVAGIYFMQDLLLFIFSKLLVSIKSKKILSLIFCFMGAFLSAFLDALTVTAVLITVAVGFYGIYHRFVSTHTSHNISDDDGITEEHHKLDLEQFRGFLRNLMMHGAVGTALGGATTLVGEPQNLIIGAKLKWHFAEFFMQCAAVSIPVLIIGLLTCLLLETIKILGYGYQIPESVRAILQDYVEKENAQRSDSEKKKLMVQAVVGVVLILSLAFHLAEVGVIGLMVIVLLTAFNGVIEEHQIGHAFEEALPFTALLVVFFSIVAVIHDQQLFHPVINYVLSLKGQAQLVAYYIANGVLSSISDNVFVATVYINETATHFQDIIPLLGQHGAPAAHAAADAGSHAAAVAGHAAEAGAHAVASAAHATAEQLAKIEHYGKLAVAINMGTNIPSVATPNGQAAFLFLLTSALAPLIRLSYMEMVKLALPYTITMSITGLLAVIYLL